MGRLGTLAVGVLRHALRPRAWPLNRPLCLSLGQSACDAHHASARRARPALRIRSSHIKPHPRCFPSCWCVPHAPHSHSYICYGNLLSITPPPRQPTTPGAADHAGVRALRPRRPAAVRSVRPGRHGGTCARGRVPPARGADCRAARSHHPAPRRKVSGRAEGGQRSSVACRACTVCHFAPDLPITVSNATGCFALLHGGICPLAGHLGS